MTQLATLVANSQYDAFSKECSGLVSAEIRTGNYPSLYLPGECPGRKKASVTVLAKGVAVNPQPSGIFFVVTSNLNDPADYRKGYDINKNWLDITAGESLLNNFYRKVSESDILDAMKADATSHRAELTRSLAGGNYALFVQGVVGIAQRAVANLYTCPRIDVNSLLRCASSKA